ncbi:MAG TPA: pyridoxine 5'-phosphate synthase [Candidatus Hydrogenedentes bacterium]|jgi:pyridoxine 5-phosphate synthase|nr:pyridoxine 5'-phosphate synthase [Candidatus Hydrogenedentota bacterium]HOC70220.1 pyridoxine 5'-phosphate synthase [Candidatus Hydrogenedentota bacterium]HOH31408.1 pyridoxine 5'-phosphate synthase [Candidatus Hydrogenedentota bacterium]
MIALGVNIDHVATLRQARRGVCPDIIAAAKICEMAGAHQITVHLRKDRRHIQDKDVHALKETLLVNMNLEMAAEDEIIGIAQSIQPYTVCLVPEKREEITTEGGLDVAGQVVRLTEVVQTMHAKGIRVSMFIDPEPGQVEASVKSGADAVELHTGAYANAIGAKADRELSRLWDCAEMVADTSMELHAGHGLTVRNLLPVARMPFLHEVNIGHDIMARALFIGLDAAVKEILGVLRDVEMAFD